ncbi:hypothetical protein MKW92_000818 [Papaver armeniacum]|nr:hypothetical protein MKW92_000818 [Papaver armeniacum]
MYALYRGVGMCVLGLSMDMQWTWSVKVFLFFVSGKMVSPICNNSCLALWFESCFCYTGLSKIFPRL